MPQEMKKVNGRWVVTGSPQSSDLVPFVKPKAAAVKPAAGPKPAAKPKAKPWWAKLGNDALYELKQLAAPPLQRNPLRDVQRAATSPLARAVPQQLGLATVGAVDNTSRMAYSLYQRHVQKKPKADPSAGRVGEALDSYVDTAYRVLGATPPSQMSTGQREADLTRRSLALNAGLGLIPGAGLGALGATTALGTAVRGAGAFALNELASNYLDDNTVGNIVNLINQFTFDPSDTKGVPFIRATKPARGVTDAAGNWTGEMEPAEKGFNLPGAVNVGADDMVDAANKSLIPNTAAGLALGGAVGLGASAFRNIQRRTRAGRAVQAETNERAFQENAGLIQKNEDGSYPFTEQARQPAEPAPAAPAQAAPARSPMDEFKAANAALEEQLGMRPPAAAAPEPAPIPSIENPTTQNFGKAEAADLPEADLDADVWDVEYDPSLPESTALGRVVDDLDDEELAVVAQGQGPVVEQVNQLVETRPPLEVNPSARLDMAAAPTANLAQPVVPFNEQWPALPSSQLRSLASPDNSPELFSRIQGMTGKEFEEFSKTDILDGLAAFENDGITVMPNRLMEFQQVMGTTEIFTDPKRFQYKSGVDAAGVQRQGSLDGVEGWNTDAEGQLQVWTDPMDGKPYVVNGHNRLAAAKRLGIPSVRVEELLAGSAEQARAQGAISNIASGGGTVFDAAKFLRDSGVTDPAQLKQMGVPLDSGLGGQGLALSRLPGNLFQDAVDGRLSLGKAVALGGSGLDEVQMQAAMKAMAGSDITDAAFGEVLLQARSAPVMQGTQADLFGNTESMSLMRQKGELAAKIRADLIGDKNLFGRVGRNANKLQEAGNRISVEGSTQVAMDAQQVLATFDSTKYAQGTPISQLLNQGAEEIANGAKPAAIAKRIKAQLVNAAEATPPVEVQSDLLSAATRTEQAPVAAEPAILPAAERQALKAQVLQKAIAGGEVRPPSTPIPELPDAPLVRVDQVQAEVAAQAAPLIEIPAAAARKFNPERERGNAESLYGWANSGVPGDRQPINTVEQAVELLRAKNQVLDPDAIPGLDMDTARNDKAMGKSTPATEAVANAYRQFYGVPEPAPAIRPGSKAAQAVADEVRLAVEYSKADALNRWDQEEGLRDAFDYEARSFDEKKDLGVGAGYDEPPGRTRLSDQLRGKLQDLGAGMGDLTRTLDDHFQKQEGFLASRQQELADEVMPAEVMPKQSSTPIADAFAEQLRGMAQSDARLFRTIGEMQQVTRRAIDELSGVATPPVRPEPLRLTQAPAQPGFTLPEGLSRAAPRYGRATISFASDLDRAAYTLANDAVKPSKAAPKFREAVEAAGLNVADVVAHGKRVKAAIKQAAGGGAAPQKAMELDIPAQPFGDVAKPPTKVGDVAVRQQIEANNQTMDQIRRKAQQEGC